MHCSVANSEGYGFSPSKNEQVHESALCKNSNNDQMVSYFYQNKLSSRLITDR